MNITAATLAGYAWGKYFDLVHKDLPLKQFSRPVEGLVEATVCSVCGKILTDGCGDHKTTLWYLEGTQPTEICPVHSSQSNSIIAISRLEKEMYKSGQRHNVSIEKNPLKLNLDFLNSNYVAPRRKTEDFTAEESENTGAKTNQTVEYDYNYLME